MANDPFDTSDIVNAKIQVRRGVNDDRITKTFEEGELVYSTDSRRLYVGGTIGSTKILGGSVVGNVLHYTTNILTLNYVETYDLVFNPTTTTLYTLTAKNAKTISDFAVIFDSNLYLKKSNPEIKSDFNCNNFKIINLGDATQPKDAVNKKTLESSMKSLSGDLDKKLSTIQSSFESNILRNYVEKNGDTMTGMLEIDTDLKKGLYVRSGDSEFQNTLLRNLTVVGDLTIKAPNASSSSTLDINANTTFNDKVIKNFTANVIVIKDITTLKLTYKEHNGQILFLEKTASVGSTDKIVVQINQNQLIGGFNCVIIQGGTQQIKISTTDKNIFLLNPDNKYTTRKQYSQINLCMIDSSRMWVSGDLVQ